MSKLPMKAVCVCGKRRRGGYVTARLKAVRLRDGRILQQVQCTECLRAGPAKATPAAAINAWNDETTAIKNPRDDLAAHLDPYRHFYGPLEGTKAR
jgi:hypothetical protein